MLPATAGPTGSLPLATLALVGSRRTLWHPARASPRIKPHGILLEDVIGKEDVASIVRKTLWEAPAAEECANVGASHESAETLQKP